MRKPKGADVLRITALAIAFVCFQAGSAIAQADCDPKKILVQNVHEESTEFATVIDVLIKKANFASRDRNTNGDVVYDGSTFKGSQTDNLIEQIKSLEHYKLDEKYKNQIRYSELDPQSQGLYEACLMYSQRKPVLVRLPKSAQHSTDFAAEVILSPWVEDKEAEASIYVEGGTVSVGGSAFAAKAAVKIRQGQSKPIIIHRELDKFLAITVSVINHDAHADLPPEQPRLYVRDIYTIAPKKPIFMSTENKSNTSGEQLVCVTLDRNTNQVALIPDSAAELKDIISADSGDSYLVWSKEPKKYTKDEVCTSVHVLKSKQTGRFCGYAILRAQALVEGWPSKGEPPAFNTKPSQPDSCGY